MTTSNLYSYHVGNNYTAIFNPLYLRPLYLKTQENKQIGTLKKINKDEVYSLISDFDLEENEIHRIFSSCNLNEKYKSDEIFYDLPGTVDGFQAIYVMTTGACNLSCSHCLTKSNTSEGRWSKIKLSLEKAQKAIDFFLLNRQIDKPSSVIFYGGEPLLNWTLIQNIATYIRDKGVYGKRNGEVFCKIITNGTLLSDEYLKLIKKLDISLVLSADGPTDLNFESKPSRNINAKKKRFLIEDLIRKICVKNIDLCLSVTVSPLNLPRINSLKEWLTSMDVPFMLSAVKETSEFQTSDDFKEEVATTIVDFYDYVLSNDLIEARLSEVLECIRISRPYLQDCYAQGAEQLVLRPDGFLGSCQGFIDDEKYFFPQHIDDLSDLTKSAVKPESWRNRLALNMEPCKNCEALGVCGGGCPQQAVQRNGSLQAIDIQHCWQSKQLLKWLIEKVLISDEICKTHHLPQPILVSN